MTRLSIYLDYNATTPVAPEVADAVQPILHEAFGNPSSSHSYGRRAHVAVEQVRVEVALLIGAQRGEIVFTGCASEANNLALHGHSFRAEVAVVGQPTPETGYIVDFATLETACEKLREALDHSFLNEVEGLVIPSLEHISRWIWQRLQPQFPGLYRVVIRRDSCRQGCVYYGEGNTVR